ncbi:MAG: PepSY domain-containing protein [Chloroflexota bacterium]|nr:PepSY domain-containing protein [Chloroflexota bacterium]
MNIFNLSKRTAIIGGIVLLTAGGGTAALASDVDLIDNWRGGRLDDGRRMLSDADISVEEAIAIAEGAATGRVDDIELERFGDRLLYQIEVGRADVFVDANSGEVVAVDPDDDGDDWRDDRVGFENDTNMGDEVAITPQQAIEAARGAAEGFVDDVELDRHAGRFVYTVEVGRSEVLVDANTGSILSVEIDD